MIYKNENGTLVGIANNIPLMMYSSKTAYDNAKTAGTVPNNVLVSINESDTTTQDIEDRVTALESNYTNYGTYGNASEVKLFRIGQFQVCAGISVLNGNISASNKRITFPKEFAQRPAIVAGANANSGGYTPVVGWEDSTSFSLGTSSREDTSSTVTGSAWWIAIGLAKE